MISTEKVSVAPVFFFFQILKKTRSTQQSLYRKFLLIKLLYTLQRVTKMNKSEDQEIDTEELSEEEIQMLATGLFGMFYFFSNLN